MCVYIYIYISIFFEFRISNPYLGLNDSLASPRSDATKVYKRIKRLYRAVNVRLKAPENHLLA